LLLLDSPHVDQVTAYDYCFLEERGEINLSREQKWSVFDTAKTEVIRELTVQAGRTSYFVAKALNLEISQAKAGTPSEDFILRQKTMAQRLSVLNWISNRRSN